MRELALLLVIGNLAFLGWALLIDSPRDMPVDGVGIDPNVTRLVMAAERDAATERAARLAANRKASIPSSAPATPPPTTSLRSQCISVGPFQDLSSAAQATATVASAGHRPRQRLEQGELWVGYWVHVPGFANREDAERAVARLKQNGIDDVYISLSSGADASTSSNIVSLGVFKDSDRAQRLLQEAKGLGFAAQVSDRTRTGSLYWIDVELSAPAERLDLSLLGSQPGKILRLEQQPCPGA
jgi:cell division septation protein DedD